jgi:YidC/Oxa1 family membrane protein insertase
MDKNTYTGFFLIVLIMLGSYFLLKPSDTELKKEQRLQDSLKRVAAAKAPAAAIKTDTAKKTAAPVVDTSAISKAPFGAATLGSEKLITIENKELRIKLTTRGGRVYSVELKNYKTADKKPLILFDGDKDHFGLVFRAQDKNINTDELYFTPSAQSLSVAEKDSSSITMRLNYSATQYIDYVYTLKGTGYKVGLSIKPTGLDNVIANSGTVNLSWAASLHKQEKDVHQERQYSTVYYLNTDNEVDWLSEGKDEQKNITDKKMQWVSFKQHFFSNVLINQIFR